MYTAIVTETKPSPSRAERPEIRRYSDYRKFVQAMVAWLRATTPQFSYRYFARVAGFGSPSYLKLVMDGKRNLAPASAPRFARGLGLDASETEIFEILVELDQAPTDDARNRLYTRLARLARRDPVARLGIEAYEAYRHWYPFVLRELVALPDFRDDPSWLARRLRTTVSESRITWALGLLQRLGLLVRRDGRLEQAQRTLSTGPVVRSLGVRNFHRAMLRLAIRALDRTPRGERNITSLTVPLTRAQYDLMCERIAALRREILASTEDDQEAPREVYHVGFNIVPLTKPVD